MRVLLLGRKPVASEALRYMRSRGADIVGIGSNDGISPDPYPDRLPALARSFGIPVFGDDELYEGDSTSNLLGTVELVVSLLYQKRIRQPIIALGRLGCVNFHPAPLPQYRGWGTYNIAILENVKAWGVSAHYVDDGFDTGPLIADKSFAVDGSKETAWSLQQKTQPYLLALFKEIFDHIMAGKPIAATPQGPGRSFCKKQVLAMRHISPDDPPDMVERKTRAFWYPPNPAAEYTIAGQSYSIVNTQVVNAVSPLLAIQPWTAPETSKAVVPPVKVYFSEEDRREVLFRIDRCLATGQIAQGDNVDELEEGFKRFIDCQHALALSNGGSALEAAMRALDVEGKEVLVPTNTFFATPAGVLAAGGRVRMLDIDPNTLAPTPQAIETAITKNTVGVIIVHVGGLISKDLPTIQQLCSKAGIWLFEDCAHAHGSTLDGRKAGTFGIGGAYSLFSTKVMTSGEGGLLVTDDDAFAKKVRLLRNYGKPDPWITNSVGFGLNWRLNELAAAVGVVQLRRLPEFLAWRERVAAIYDAELQHRDELLIVRPTGLSSWYKYIVVLPADVARETVRSRMKERGVFLSGGVYDIPLHKQPVFAGRNDLGDFPNADQFCARHVCLPLYYEMTHEEACRAARALICAVESARA